MLTLRGRPYFFVLAETIALSWGFAAIAIARATRWASVSGSGRYTMTLCPDAVRGGRDVVVTAGALIGG
ncbi:hypothetical protein ASE15_19425 [Oerskovia sp. Root22]|nr:hypothetical protein ASE15_19425 [Oerskovia sp. Root22]